MRTFNFTISAIIICIISFSCLASFKVEQLELHINLDESINFSEHKNLTLPKFKSIFTQYMNVNEDQNNPITIKYSHHDEIKMGFSRKVRNILRQYHSLILIKYKTHTGNTVLVKLPPLSERKIDWTKLKKRNILHIKINDNEIIEINNESIELEKMDNIVYKFLRSEPGNLNLPELLRKDLPIIGLVNCASKSIVILEHEYNPSYKFYTKIYDIIKKQYHTIWNELTKKYFNVDRYEKLTNEEQKIIKTMLPFVLSEP